MGEAKRRRDVLAAFKALPLHLQQPPLPALICECLRPGWDGSGALGDINDGYGHVYCREPYWLTNVGQVDLRMGWMSATKSAEARAGKNPPASGESDR
jgi:hypothetical protein